jgi:hypothetical protein
MRTIVAGHQLLPKGLDLESLSVESGHVSICAEPGATRCIYPLCGHGSSRVYSHYMRTVCDLPIVHAPRSETGRRARRVPQETLRSG